MAETTHPEPSAKAADVATVGASPAAKAKVTRVQATTSGVPTKPASRSRVAIEKSAASAPAATTRAPAPTTNVAAAAAVARPANVEIHQGGADTVVGDTVQIVQGGASVVTAGSLSIRQGGIAQAQADDITVNLGGVGLARADRVSVEMGGIGLALAREAHLTQGGARTVLARTLHVDQGLIGTAIAGKVTFERPSGVFMLLAGRTEGPVRPVLDWRGALAFGAVFGVLVGLIRRR